MPAIDIQLQSLLLRWLNELRSTVKHENRGKLSVSDEDISILSGRTVELTHSRLGSMRYHINVLPSTRSGFSEWCLFCPLGTLASIQLHPAYYNAPLDPAPTRLNADRILYLFECTIRQGCQDYAKVRIFEEVKAGRQTFFCGIPAVGDEGWEEAGVEYGLPGCLGSKSIGGKGRRL